MNSPIDSFGKTAQRLATNPLGIIALFIVLVYGIAGIVFGASAEYLAVNQKEIIVWFLVLFPILVLVVFAWFVTKHHTKLYAPKDFQDATTFLRTLSATEQKFRIDKEVDEIVSDTKIIEEKVSQLPERISLNQQERSEIKKRVYLVEELVLRDLEIEYSVSIQRQIAFGSRDISIDGMFAKEGAGYGVEIKYTRRSLSKNSINQIINISKYTSENFGWKKFNFIIAVVYEDLTDIKIKKEQERISRFFSEVGRNIIIKLYDFKSLMKKYGIDEDG